MAPLNVVVGEVEVHEVRGGGEGGAEGGEAAAGQGQVPETPRLPQQRRERAGAAQVARLDDQFLTRRAQVSTKFRVSFQTIRRRPILRPSPA